jgi:hypothetical protein
VPGRVNRCRKAQAVSGVVGDSPSACFFVSNEAATVKAVDAPVRHRGPQAIRPFPGAPVLLLDPFFQVTDFGRAAPGHGTLVSHQAEFAEAFSESYHFHLEGGATRIKRFQT